MMASQLAPISEYPSLTRPLIRRNTTYKLHKRRLVLIVTAELYQFYIVRSAASITPTLFYVYFLSLARIG